MDGGSYNNIVRTGSPFSASSPTTSSNAYKANVNRTKTRKWVEARVQNYDGDDWGNDYEDDDEPEDPIPKPLQKAPTGGLPSTLRSVSQPLQPPSANATEPYGRRSFGGPDAAPSHPQHGANFAVPASQNQPAAPQPLSQPVYTTSTPPGAQPFAPPNAPTYNISAPETPATMNTVFPPRKSSMTSAGALPRGNNEPRDRFQPGFSASVQLQDSQSAPGSSPPTAGNKPKFVRPSDIYKRMSQEKEKERLSLESVRPSLDGTTGRGSGATSPEASRTSGEQRRRTSFDRDEPSDHTLHGDRTTLPTVTEKERSADNSPTKTNTFSSGLDPQAKGPKSIGPQLPEVSRMSMFGDDFFSSGIKDTPTTSTTTVAPITEPGEKQQQSLATSETDNSTPHTNGENQPAIEPQAAKKTAHGHVTRPSLPGGWVSETTNVDSMTPTPLETPGEHEPSVDARQLGEIPLGEPSSTSTGGNVAPAGTAAASDATKNLPAGSTAVQTGSSQHPTPQSLPPLKTSDPLKSTTSTIQEKPTAPPAMNDNAPATSVYQQAPQATTDLQSTTASPYGQNPVTMPVYSQHESAIPTFAPPRKSTLSSVTTASPLKESDMLREEIMRSLSPAVDAPTSTARLGSQNKSSPNVPEPPRESRSLSGIYDDYYGFTEDKALQETGQYLKSEPRTQDSGDDAARSQAVATSDTTALPEIRPLSPNKQGVAKPKINTENRERRFSFDAGPEHVTLSPVEAPTSTAVSFGSNSETQVTQPEYMEADRTESISSPAPQAPVASPETTADQLLAPTQTITHQVSQMSIGAAGDVDVNMIEQPSPLSGSKSGTPRATTPVPVEDKVLIQPETKMSDEHRTPEADSHPIFMSNEPVVPPKSEDGTIPAVNTSSKIMPFREILSIGLPQHRIQRFDETRAQFFDMDTGLGDWLRHMQSQMGGAIGDHSHGGNDSTSPEGASPSQQPYYQQYLNASNPNLSMPAPARSNTINLGAQSANAPQGQQGTSSFNTGGQVGTKGKELLQAAGVLGNKGMKTGMKFFNKSKTKLRERGDKVFN